MKARYEHVFGPFPNSKVNEIVVSGSIQFFIRPKGHLAHILSQVLSFRLVKNEIPFFFSNCVSFVNNYMYLQSSSSLA